MMIDETEIIVEKKNIKNMYIRVKSDGTVKVTAPKKVKDDAVRNFVYSRKDWIDSHRQAVLKRQAAEPDKNNFTRLDLWGKTYPIEIVITNGRPRVEKHENKILLFLDDSADNALKEKTINEWYRGLLKKEVNGIFAECEKIVGIKANEWHIRNMKTKWGTCNIKDKRIWLNLQLAKKPPECLRYVIIHELTHLRERGHNSVFKRYMDEYCADWRQIKKILNS
ncbi:MAG: M48 family metallopeptidase [Bacillota bacterium]|jgi:predicted metal-dependent hydrolase